MKRARWFIAWLVLAALSAGCKGDRELKTDKLILSGEAATPEAEEPADPHRIALVMKTLTNPFFKEMEKGARAAEAELGVELIVKTGAQETSIEQQIAIVKELVREEVDAIVIAPGSSTELIPALAEAQDAGIAIINIDNRLDAGLIRDSGMTPVPFIGVDNEAGAYASASALAERLTGPAEVAILEGIPSAQNARDRKQGALRAFSERADIDVVASESAHWKLDEGYRVTAGLLERHPDLGALFCANDMMALGALRYLEESGKTDVPVASYDALDEAIRAIRQGKLVATIDQQAAVQGYKGVEFAARAIAGERLPPDTHISTKLITAETLRGR